MGDRANYVIKTGRKLDIYYNKWSATRIESDLYLGEHIFLDFVRTCDVHEHLLDPIFLEAFVIADIEKKILGYWSWHMEMETSVMRYYQSALQEKWPDWQIIHLANNMYDAEPLLEIGCVAQQQPVEPDVLDVNMITYDPIDDEWVNGLFVIKDEGEIHVVASHNATVESVICYGQAAVSVLKTRPDMSLPKEGETPSSDHLLIDVDNKVLILNASQFGLHEYAARQWPDYTFKMGKIGYLAMLETGGINTAGLEMPQQKVIDIFNHIIKPKEADEPSEMWDIGQRATYGPFYDVEPGIKTFPPQKIMGKPAALSPEISLAKTAKPKPISGKTSLIQKLGNGGSALPDSFKASQ